MMSSVDITTIPAAIGQLYRSKAVTKIRNEARGFRGERTDELGSEDCCDSSPRVAACVL